MSSNLHLQAALAAAKARHLERSGFDAGARSFWREAAMLELSAVSEGGAPIERARLRRSAALFAMRAGDTVLAGSILRPSEGPGGAERPETISQES